MISRARELKNVPGADSNSGPLKMLNAGEAAALLLHDVDYEESLLRDDVGYRQESATRGECLLAERCCRASSRTC